MEKDYQLINNKEKQQYEYHVSGLIPLIEYVFNGDNAIYLTHTEVPMQLEGQGIGTCLVKDVLEDIDKNNMKVVPLCPFVAGYIQKHPEWRRIVMIIED